MLQIFTYYIVKKEPCQGFLCSGLYLVVVSFYDILTFLKIFSHKIVSHNHEHPHQFDDDSGCGHIQQE